MRHWVARVAASVRFSSARGQDVVEYGLMIAAIAVVVLIGIKSFGDQIEPWFRLLAGRITTT